MSASPPIKPFSLALRQFLSPTNAGVARQLTAGALDQDTGGAIRAAGRCDLYFGIGQQAESLAGEQFSFGRMYYFVRR